MSTGLQYVEASRAPETASKTSFGFWLYLMTDCVLFAALFATYAVLHNNTFGGPGSHELFNPSFVLGETVILLTSSFACGLALLSLRQNNKRQAVAWLLITLLLGLAFLGIEIVEFHTLAAEGNGWGRSAFLSSFFTLVGTHGLHITIGLLWGVVLSAQVLRRGAAGSVLRRFTLFSMFWHFLDIVWIFIFTLVYMVGIA